MERKRFIPILIAGLVIVAVGLYLSVEKTVTVRVDGEMVEARSRALTVGGVLRDAGLAVYEGDQVEPGMQTWFIKAPVISIERAQALVVFVDGEQISLAMTGAIPGDILAEAGISLNAGDRIEWNGETVDANAVLPGGRTGVLVVKRAVTLTVIDELGTKTISSAAATVGQALWEAGIDVGASDAVSLPLETPMEEGLTIAIGQARAFVVTADGEARTVSSAATTVGEVLAENGLALQGLDYSIPAEDQATPEDGRIRVVRVQEVVETTQNYTPYESEYVEDANTELDQESVVEAGEPGISMQRERIRYEDGVEVGRTIDAEWVVQEPKTEKVGYGTKVVVRTEEINGTTIEYWRKITVYATSYSPCRLGTGSCSTGTASGMTLTQGVVAVTVNWFLDMRGQNIYVPGYGKGIIADTGGGIPGRYWIDLGYTDETYQSWHQWVTIYFLTPVPEYIPYLLYP